MATSKIFVKALDSAGRGCRMSKKDMKNAYKLIAIPRRDRYLQCLKWLGMFFVELAGIFGASSACGAFDEFHERLIWDLVMPKCEIPKHLVMKTIDDVPTVVPKNRTDWLLQFDQEYNSMCSHLGISLAPPAKDADKAFENVTKGVVLGILYDTEEWTWTFQEPKRLSKNQKAVRELLFGSWPGRCPISGTDDVSFGKCSAACCTISVPSDSILGIRIICYFPQATCLCTSGTKL